MITDARWRSQGIRYCALNASGSLDNDGSLFQLCYTIAPIEIVNEYWVFGTLC
jgi:hypothetical protein